MNNINGILFDMDGTVLDSEALFDDAQLLFLKDMGVHASIQDLKEFKGMSYKHFYPRFTSKFNITLEVNIIRSKIRTYLHEIMETRLKFIKGSSIHLLIHLPPIAVNVLSMAHNKEP